MPMDPISGLTGIMRALRERMSSRTEKKGGNTKASSVTSAQGSTAASNDVAELERKVTTRLLNLRPEERTSPQAARIFVETTLAWEFGDEILNDPAFLELAADIQQAINESPVTREQFSEMLKSLSER